MCETVKLFPDCDEILHDYHDSIIEFLTNSRCFWFDQSQRRLMLASQFDRNQNALEANEESDWKVFGQKVGEKLSSNEKGKRELSDEHVFAPRENVIPLRFEMKSKKNKGLVLSVIGKDKLTHWVKMN